MMRRSSHVAAWGRAGLLALLAVVGQFLTGCQSFKWRGDPFPDDEVSDWVGKFRSADPTASPFGLSTKARQIEQNCGVR